MRKHALLIAFLFLIAATLYSTACGDFFVSGGTVDHITMNPTSVFLSTSPTAETKQFAAQAVNVDGSSTDVTGSSTWDTGNHTLATVSTAGLLTAKAAGNTTVTATKGGVVGTANVVVGTAALNTTLQVTDNNDNTSNLKVSSATPLQLKATGTAGNTIILTNFVTWSSSSTNFTVSGTGLVSVSGTTSGQTATITATIATATASATGNVTVTAQ